MRRAENKQTRQASTNERRRALKSPSDPLFLRLYHRILNNIVIHNILSALPLIDRTFVFLSICEPHLPVPRYSPIASTLAIWSPYSPSFNCCALKLNLPYVQTSIHDFLNTEQLQSVIAWSHALTSLYRSKASTCRQQLLVCPRGSLVGVAQFTHGEERYANFTTK